MNKNKLKIFVSTILVVTSLAIAGCVHKLELGGAYSPSQTNSLGVVTAVSAPDMALYTADSTFALAYATADGAFTFERNNRAFLWKVSPNIKHNLDKIRPQAVDIKNRYLAARKIYIANPIPANLSTLNLILAELQKITVVATSSLVNVPKP